MNIKKEIIESGAGYGYKIYRDDKIFIIQDHLPAISGNRVMTESQAERLSNLVLKRLEKKPNELPTLTVEEVEEVLSR